MLGLASRVGGTAVTCFGENTASLEGSLLPLLDTGHVHNLRLNTGHLEKSNLVTKPPGFTEVNGLGVQWDQTVHSLLPLSSHYL